MTLYNGVARTLKKKYAHQGEITGTSSDLSTASLYKMETSLKGKNLLQVGARYGNSLLPHWVISLYATIIFTHERRCAMGATLLSLKLYRSWALSQDTLIIWVG